MTAADDAYLPKSVSEAGGLAIRTALITTTRSMTSCATAPATGEMAPAAAKPIPTTLSAMPPIAL